MSTTAKAGRAGALGWNLPDNISTRPSRRNVVELVSVTARRNIRSGKRKARSTTYSPRL